MAPGPLGVGPSRGGLRQGPAGVCVLGGGASSLALPGPRSTKPLGGLGVGGVGRAVGPGVSQAHPFLFCLFGLYAPRRLYGPAGLSEGSHGCGPDFLLKDRAGRVLAQPTSNCQDLAEQTLAFQTPLWSFTKNFCCESPCNLTSFTPKEVFQCHPVLFNDTAYVYSRV